MSNVIALTVPPRMRSLDARLAGLLRTFAEGRRQIDDVFWLKENAELLNILECTGLRPSAEALDVHRPVYGELVRRMEFFPQYYRFYLSLALDLEALGMDGSLAQRLVDFAAKQELADNELSDLQRMEARRLMARRGVVAVPGDTGLEDRMRAFMRRAQAFMLPNKKAAYELTHAVFYLSEYGRRDPGLGEPERLSLIYAGILAFLDLNADLLAEICIALRFAGEEPPQDWTDWLDEEARAFVVEEDPLANIADDYHTFLICNWHSALRGGRAFADATDGGRACISRIRRERAPLMELSRALYRMDEDRSGDWTAMQDRVGEALSPEASGLLARVAGSSPMFERFFEGFARTSMRT